MTGLVPFADRILRPVLDRQTAARASIVGCCMIDMNGFLPTHISERSQPQGEDEEENHLYSRNRCRSEEHTSELQSLMRISYAVFCLKKKHTKKHTTKTQATKY